MKRQLEDVAMAGQLYKNIYVQVNTVSPSAFKMVGGSWTLLIMSCGSLMHRLPA